MKRTPIQMDPGRFPEEFHPLLAGAALYDSSCSRIARVTFIDRDGGYYLKSAAAGSLKKEALLTQFFHQKGMGPKVETYLTEGQDWLLTQRVPGEDCMDAMYLENPRRLCDTLAEVLCTLHAMNTSGCPVQNRTAEYLACAEANFRAGMFDPSYLLPHQAGMTAQEAWEKVAGEGHLLCADTLLHGDYCLPNVMLENWKFSGLIDLCHAGVGDRHIDIYWALWSLAYNIRSEALADRFMDAYGRGKINPDTLELIAAAETFG